MTVDRSLSNELSGARPGHAPGQAVAHALGTLGYDAAGGVRVGRAIELGGRAASAADAEARTRRMCDRLFANPVTEDYTVQVEAV